MADGAITEADWVFLRRKALDGLTPESVQQQRESVLLPYQKVLLQATASNQVTVCEKSRRIGATWAVGADAVLHAGAQRAAGGMDVFYIGYNLDMTREFIDTCASWARAFSFAATEVGEFLFEAEGDEGIQAFRIRFASGFEIVALCSRPRSLRGRQGYVIIDEAAFHDDLAELLKAALALLIWGGKVLIISTHNGAENHFNEVLQECRSGKRKYALVRCTFDEALEQGLYQRICLKLGREWSAEGEAVWRAGIRSNYGDAAGEELDCIPRHGGGRYLSRVLLEARARERPIVRWSCDESFVDATDDARGAACREWCERELRPLLDQMHPDRRTSVGGDFGRSGDLSIFWPLAVEPDLKRDTPFVIELRNVPFREQEQILLYLCARLPRLSGIALDARGNGQYLAERARQTYGASVVAQVMLTEGWYRENMPKLKAAIEDDKLVLVADADTIDDLRAIEVIRGVPRIPEARTKGASGQRHGDAAVAVALAVFASFTIEGGPVEFLVEGQMRALGAPGAGSDFDGPPWP